MMKKMFSVRGPTSNKKKAIKCVHPTTPERYDYQASRSKRMHRGRIQRGFLNRRVKYKPHSSKPHNLTIASSWLIFQGIGFDGSWSSMELIIKNLKDPGDGDW